MRRRARIIVTVAAILCGIAVVTSAIALYTLQTNWFKQRVREKIVSAAEQASGGRVELGSFNYHWHTLSAGFTAFVVHGTEPTGAPPLFRASSIRVGLRIVSLLKRDVDIRLLEIDRPQIHVSVHPDGSTNLPQATAGRTASGFVSQLFSLKVDRFEINDGVLQIDTQKFPLAIRGDGLHLLLTYEKAAPQYRASVAARNVRCGSSRLRGFSGKLSANMRLERDRLWLDDFAFAAPGAKLHASGGLLHFANPAADFRVDAQVDATHAATLAGVPALEEGDVALDGALHYDGSALASFAGKVSGRKLRYRFDSTVLHNVDFDSAVVVGGEKVSFTNLSIGALGGRINGDAVVKQSGNLKFTGRFSGFDLRQISTFRQGSSLPWTGIANGTLHLAGTLGRRNFTVQSIAHIVPRATGVPVSGDLDISYRQLGEVLAFGDSHLNLPRTRISFSGTAFQTLHLILDSTGVNELSPALPAIFENGSVHFDGTIAGTLSSAYLQGNIAATQFRFGDLTWRQMRSHMNAASGGVDFSSLTADSGSLHVTGSGHLGLENWRPQPASAVRLAAKFQGADLPRISSGFLPAKFQVLQGIGSGSMNLAGTIADPRGSVNLHIYNLDAFGQRINTVQLDAAVEGNRVRITQGKIQAGLALLSFSGAYERTDVSWEQGLLDVKADSNGFPVASLAAVRNHEPGLQAQAEIHGQAKAKITAEHVEPIQADGRLTLRGIAINGVPVGSIALGVATRSQMMDARFSGDLRETRISGAVQVGLAPGLPSTGEVHLDRIALSTLYALAMPARKEDLPLAGFVQGEFTFTGPLEHPEQMRANLRLDQAELSSGVPGTGETRAHTADLIFHNAAPIVLDAANGIAKIRSLEIQGKDTALSVRGTIPYLQQRPLDLSVGGSVDLRILQLLDPNLRSSGQSGLAMSLTGTLANPAINGTLQLKNGSFFLNGVANGLSGVNGMLNFNRDRATLQGLTAQTGGGRVSLTGFVTYGAGGPFVYRLEGNAEEVRMRYGGSGSITSNADLQLTGTSKNSLLSGTVTVSRVAFNPNTDVGTLLASIAAPAPANEQDFLTGLQLDVRIESASNLQLSTALSRDVEAAIDLRLRGTLSHPTVLGTVSANQGDIKVFGTKYSINRAEVSFRNAVKIEPMLDLDLQTRARGVVVDITISGTPGKLNINYRSDPPLQPRDIIALLTVGRAPDVAPNVPSGPPASDATALQSGADTVLGAAISPNSSRLQKLFGVANIKIDPMVQGITNTMQRLTIEQQISRDITVTYVTNLSQTSEQIFRLEWALSQQYSLVALRDDNGEFGIDIQYKKRFK